MRILMTIRHGGYQNWKALFKTLKEAGCIVTDWSKNIMGKPAFTVSVEIMESDLVVVSGLELGFKEKATGAVIYQKALGQGLLLCPAEVGPLLRLQYMNQPHGESLLIAMEPIVGPAGLLFVFIIQCNGGDRWLGTDYGRPDKLWGPDDLWVFVRPRK